MGARAPLARSTLCADDRKVTVAHSGKSVREQRCVLHFGVEMCQNELVDSALVDSDDLFTALLVRSRCGKEYVRRLRVHSEIGGVECMMRLIFKKRESKTLYLSFFL